jgi:hypothetical protein
VTSRAVALMFVRGYGRLLAGQEVLTLVRQLGDAELLALIRRAPL